MAEVIKCVRCSQKLPALEKAPFGSALGKKIHEQICQACWKQWVASQVNPEHQQFLIQNMESFLFGTGLDAKIDTSLEGTIQH